MIERKYFIVVEGIDGTGKSTVTRRVVDILHKSLGSHVKLTFEPHDPSSSGVYIRQVLMKRIKNVPLHTLALAFAVNRSDHCNREIVPFLNSGKGDPRVVFCDRYYLSSLVYQSDDEFSFDDVMKLNSYALKPDLIIFMNATNKTCYSRMRSRNQDKELFEKNIGQVRTKYFEAIDYLKGNGDNIVEIDANGDMPDVLNKVLDAITDNAPKWLNVNYPLPMDMEEEFFEKSKITIKECALRLANHWSSGPIFRENQLSEMLDDMKTSTNKLTDSLSLNDVATLFLDSLDTKGFTVKDKLPWIDLDAYEVSFNLPFGMELRGTVLIIGNTQRYDAIIQKLLGEKIETLQKMSDFIFILDSNPSHMLSQHYERDMIQYSQTESALTPTNAVIGREEISNLILSKALELFKDEYFQTLMNNPTFKKVFNSYESNLDIEIGASDYIKNITSCSKKGLALSRASH